MAKRVLQLPLSRSLAGSTGMAAAGLRRRLQFGVLRLCLCPRMALAGAPHTSLASTAKPWDQQGWRCPAGERSATFSVLEQVFSMTALRHLRMAVNMYDRVDISALATLQQLETLHLTVSAVPGAWSCARVCMARAKTRGSHLSGGP